MSTRPFGENTESCVKHHHFIPVYLLGLTVLEKMQLTKLTDNNLDFSQEFPFPQEKVRKFFIFFRRKMGFRSSVTLSDWRKKTFSAEFFSRKTLRS